MGRKDTKREKCKLNDKRRPKNNWWHPPLPTDVFAFKQLDLDLREQQ